MQAISLEDFEKLCVELFRQREFVDAETDKLKVETTKMEQLKRTILAHLEEIGKDKYPVKDHGVLYTVDRFTVATPKSLEEKKAFFDYLVAKGIFLEMASVNSMTLNSFYKAEMEAAVTEGNVDFKIPGIGEPSHIKTLNIRKS